MIKTSTGRPDNELHNHRCTGPLPILENWSEQPLPGLEDLEQSSRGNRRLEHQRCFGPNIPDLDNVRTVYLKRNNIVGVHKLIADSYKEFGFQYFGFHLSSSRSELNASTHGGF